MASNIGGNWGVSIWKNSPWTGLFWQKMQGDLYLYPLASRIYMERKTFSSACYICYYLKWLTTMSH